MLLSFSIIAVFMSLILLYFNARQNSTTIYLGIFFFLVSLYCFSQFVLLYSKSVLLITIFLGLFNIIFPPLYLIGPMLFWYIRSVLNDNPKLKKRDTWHLLPMFLFFLASLPYISVPLSEKIEVAERLVNNVGIMQTYAVTILSDLFSVSAIYLSRPILVLFYTLWSIVLLMRYLLQKKLAVVFPRQRFLTKWLCFLLGFVFILTTSHILLIVKTFSMNFSELAFGLNVIRVLSITGLSGLLISPFLFPEILYGLPRLPKTLASSISNAYPIRQQQKEEKNGTNHFENKYISEIIHKVDFCMNEHQSYLQSHFNLTFLSVQTNIPVHHLSYFFREVKKQHFNDYRNSWRINYAKKLIMEGKANEMTIEAIGLMSGFSNRNSFYSTFKKFEGLSPGAFANQIKK